MAQTEELKTGRRNTKLFDFGRSLFSFAPRFKREKLPLLAARGFREERAMLLEKVWPLQHFRVTPNRWTKMPRHIMISTIFEKNRLERLLKPINGKLVPSFMIETRQELE